MWAIPLLEISQVSDDHPGASPWMTPTCMDDLPFTDDLLKWLAFGYWTTLMDESEMVLFFGTPSIAPLSKGRLECCWVLTRALMILIKFRLFQITPRVVILLVDSLRRFHFSKKLLRVTSWMAHVALLTSPLGPINRYILSLTLHLSHNFSSAISSNKVA